MGSIDIEICTNCEWEIARSEQAYVFEGKIVCGECDNTLRSGPVDEPAEILEPPTAPEPIITVQSQSEAPNLSESVEQEKANQRQDADKPVGSIIVGVILCLLSIGLISIGLVSSAVLFLSGMPIFGILMAGFYLASGILIFISGIVVTVISVISRQS